MVRKGLAIIRLAMADRHANVVAASTMFMATFEILMNLVLTPPLPGIMQAGGLLCKQRG